MARYGITISWFERFRFGKNAKQRQTQRAPDVWGLRHFRALSTPSRPQLGGNRWAAEYYHFYVQKKMMNTD